MRDRRSLERLAAQRFQRKVRLQVMFLQVARSSTYETCCSKGANSGLQLVADARFAVGAGVGQDDAGRRLHGAGEALAVGAMPLHPYNARSSS